jgi:choline-glycine betaine transporter
MIFNNNPFTLLASLLAAAIALLLICLIMSCSSHKSLSSAQTHSDSTYSENWKDSADYYKQQWEYSERKNREDEYNEVKYKKEPCPELKEIHCPGLNTDSINAIIRKLNSYTAGLENQVQILADGSRIYKGNIASFRYSMQKQKDSLYKSYLIIDSLTAKLHEKKVEVVHDTVQKKSDRKTTVLPWYWAVMIGFAGATVLFKGGLVKKLFV